MSEFAGRKHPSTAKGTRRAQMQEARQLVAREAAEQRQADYNKLTTLQKIERLDRNFGPNQGAVKQRAKLKAILENDAARVEHVAKPKDHKEKRLGKRTA